MRGFGEILALGEHPPRERTRRVTPGAAQEWAPPAERARWLGVGASSLAKRHSGPLTEPGAVRAPPSGCSGALASRRAAPGRPGKGGGGWP